MKLTERLAKVGSDKWMHFTASLVLADLITRCLSRCGVGCIISAGIGFVVSLVMGICKELYDKFKERETFDLGDIKADIIGALWGSVLGII